MLLQIQHAKMFRTNQLEQQGLIIQLRHILGLQIQAIGTREIRIIQHLEIQELQTVNIQQIVALRDKVTQATAQAVQKVHNLVEQPEAVQVLNLITIAQVVQAAIQARAEVHPRMEEVEGLLAAAVLLQGAVDEVGNHYN